MTPAPSSPARSPVLSGAPTASMIEAAATWLRTQLEASGQDRFVLGLSGGVDSAVVAALAVRAVGPSRVLLVSMPYQAPRSDGPLFPLPASVRDAREMVATLPGAPYVTIDITARVDLAAEALGSAMAALRRLGPAFAHPVDPSIIQVALGNLKARERAVTLRGLSNLYRGLVLGTENRTEHLLGYFTISGDEDSDLEVLSPFFKTEVRALASALNVPAVIQAKAPTADLWHGQTDEGELGFTYPEADRILGALDRGIARAHVAAETASAPATVARVLARLDATAFKRTARPTFAIPSVVPASPAHASPRSRV